MAVVSNKQRKAISHDPQRIADAKKRRQTVEKHIQKVYAGKEFTACDIKKSLALAIRSWQDVSQVQAEINFCIQAAGAEIVGKQKIAGKRGKPVNIYMIKQ